MNKKIASPHYESQPKYQVNYNTDANMALNHIPSELPHAEWVRVAAAYKAASGNFDTFNEWSCTASNYRLSDASAVWKSLKTTGGITAGTLFYIAQQYGYQSTATPSAAEIQIAIKTAQQQKQVENEARLYRHVMAQKKAEAILDRCQHAAPCHRYLISKQIQPHPALMPWEDYANNLVIPVMDIQGNLHSLQLIDPIGNKRFLAGGAIKSHFYQLWSRNKPSKAIVICEGYATGVTLYTQYTQDCSVVIAFNAGNLRPVAEVFRAAFPDAQIIIAGDNDKSGTGQKLAEIAAIAVGGSFTIPYFLPHESGSDFNDRWCLDNKEVAA